MNSTIIRRHRNAGRTTKKDNSQEKCPFLHSMHIYINCLIGEYTNTIACSEKDTQTLLAL